MFRGKVRGEDLGCPAKIFLRGLAAGVLVGEAPACRDSLRVQPGISDQALRVGRLCALGWTREVNLQRNIVTRGEAAEDLRREVGVRVVNLVEVANRATAPAQSPRPSSP